MKRLLSFIFLILLCHSAHSQADSVYFIGEVRWKLDGKSNGELGARIPYSDYVQKYKINRLYIVDRVPKINLSISEWRKESYYLGSEVNCVEVRIGMPRAVFNDENNFAMAEGYLNVNGVTNKKKIPPFKIIKPTRNSIDYVNPNTYKLHTPIEISFPEEVSLSVITSYINNKIYNTSNAEDGFSFTLKQLDSIRTHPGKGPLTYNILMNFYRFLNFLEPYVAENSFLNSEADQLKQKLDYPIKNDTKTRIEKAPNEDSSQMTKEDYEFSRNVYNSYLSFYKAIKTYYWELREILFLRTPVQYRDSLGILDNLSINDVRKENAFRFALMSGVSFGFTNNYNVTISIRDTPIVHFEKLSRINPTISAGLVWTINTKRLRNDSTHKETGLLSRSKSMQPEDGKLLLGAFFNYYVSPTHKHINAKFPFGMGLGIGYRIGNLGILGTANFRTIRYPRKYFIDEFKDKNKSLIINGNYQYAIDIDDNRYFFDKADFTFGISISYLLKRKITQ